MSITQWAGKLLSKLSGSTGLQVQKLKAETMAPVTIYLSAYCPFCHRATALLEKKGVSFDVISVDSKPDVRQEMTKKAGSHTVPQIWVGDTHVGGCDELYALERSGSLDPLLTGKND